MTNNLLAGQHKYNLCYSL